MYPAGRVLTLVSSAGTYITGESISRDGVAQYFQKMLEVFVLGEHELNEYEFIETGDTLVIVGCETGGTALPTGKVFDLAFVWVVRFDEQGRIKYLREHNDTAAIGDAFLS
jgi:ketosteroid isomerase-like protein